MAMKPRTAPSFTSIMDMPVEDMLPPKPVPAGDYVGMVVGHPEPGEASTGTKFWTFTIQLLEAVNDSPSFLEDLQNSLTMGDGSVQALREKTVQMRMFDTQASAHRFKKFIADLGISMVDERGRKKTGSEVLEETAGRQVLVTLSHRASQRSEGVVFAEVTGTAKSE